MRRNLCPYKSERIVYCPPFVVVPVWFWCLENAAHLEIAHFQPRKHPFSAKLDRKRKQHCPPPRKRPSFLPPSAHAPSPLKRCAFIKSSSMYTRPSPPLHQLQKSAAPAKMTQLCHLLLHRINHVHISRTAPYHERQTASRCALRSFAYSTKDLPAPLSSISSAMHFLPQPYLHKS